MTTLSNMSPAIQPDADLVGATLAGNRDAFGQIVSRYQSLVCSLAYSATGSLGQSEDLAQETFIIAWKRLSYLRERDKLRAWLCGIARNRINDFLRREGREPNHQAESIEAIPETHALDPQPVDHAISQEEAAILWRSLERIPEIYREPLVLFYREQQSIEAVAAHLDLSEEAVKQRLSRGRKLLQEQVIAFVEGALGRTTPGSVFTASVLAALPASLAGSAKIALLGASAAKGGSMAKAAVAGGLLGLISGPLLLVFGNYAGYRMSLAEAASEAERRSIKVYHGRIIGAAFGVFTLFTVGLLWFCQNRHDYSVLPTLLVTSFIVIYVAIMFGCAAVAGPGRKKALAEILKNEGSEQSTRPAWEFRSRASVLGLPLVHIRLGDRFALLKKPVKAWVAVGDQAIGGLFAFGGVAIAPVSLGGVAVGVLPFGAIAIGIISLGAFAFGGWAFGGLAIGWQACGGGAFAINGAIGGLAFAQNFALGDIAHALQANNQVARQLVDSNLFFRWAQFYGRHGFLMNLIWVIPIVASWQITARFNQRKKPDPRKRLLRS
jgi:RNA polymerase sigma factor (sigma-70 family)